MIMCGLMFLICASATEVRASFDPNADGDVLSIVVQSDGKIVVGGNFNNIGGAQHIHIVRLNPDGMADPTFNATVGSGPGETVRVVAVQLDGKVLIGGDFQSVNGITRHHIARLNIDGSVDTGFDPDSDGVVNSITIQSDGKIIVGGGYGNIGGQPRSDIARLNTNGTADLVFNPGSDDPVYSIIIQTDGKIVFGGDFTHFAGGTLRRRLARLNTDLSLDMTYDPNVQGGGIRSMGLQSDGKIVVGGTFVQIGATFPLNRIARINTNGTVDAGFNPNANPGGDVEALALQPDGAVVFSGGFTAVGGTPRLDLARVTSTGSLDAAFNPNPNDVPRALALQSDGKIIVGGSFTSIGGQTRNRIARLKANGALDVLRSPFDFDGDGKTDVSLFRSAEGNWYLNQSTAGFGVIHWGASGDLIAPGDYDGDGKTDTAIFRFNADPALPDVYILNSNGNTVSGVSWGLPGDIPACSDFDGDGKTDVAVYRPSETTWYILKSTGGIVVKTFGLTTDQPVAADYDGDGKADIALFRPNGANGADWWIQRSTAGTLVLQFGSSTDKAIPGDFTGDGKSDVAIFRPGTGQWFVLRSEDFSYYAFPFGAAGDVPVPGDYDGDGKTDAAVFRPPSATWFVQRSTAGTMIQVFGLSSDQPVPNAYVR